MSDYYNVNGYPQKKPTGLAIASLVCGIVGLLCINPCGTVTAAALICGLIALLSSNQGGKALAIAGIVLGGIQVILEIALAIFSFGATLLF